MTLRKSPFILVLIAASLTGSLATWSCGSSSSSSGGGSSNTASSGNESGGSASSDPHDGGAAQHAGVADTGPYLEGQDREFAVRHEFQQSNPVHNCWNTAMRHNPVHRGEDIVVRLHVAQDGAAHAEVDGANDPQFAQCIRMHVSQHHFGRGQPIILSAEFQLAGAE